MTPDNLAVLVNDSRLTSDALRLVLYVSALGPGEHEIAVEQLTILLGCQREGPVNAARKRAEHCGYLKWRRGGKGHHNRYELVHVNVESNENSSADSRTQNYNSTEKEIQNDRSTNTKTQTPLVHVNVESNDPSRTRASSPPPSTSPPPTPPTARENAKPADTDLERLRSYLGDHSRAVDMMLGSAVHPPEWVVTVHGKYGPSGTQTITFRGIQKERWPAVLANALMDYATGRHEFKNNHFDGFVRKAADNERNGNRRDSGARSEAPAAAIRATGTDGAYIDSKGRNWGIID